MNTCATFISETIVKVYEALVPYKQPVREENNGFLATTNAQIRHVKFLKSKNSPLLQSAIEKRDRMIAQESERRISNYVNKLSKDKNFIFKIFKKSQFQPQITHLKTEQGEKITDPLQIAEELNLFYGSVLKVSQPCNINWFSKKGIIDSIEITESMVYDVIMGAKNSSSRGPDLVSNRMLKVAPEVLITPLTLLFRQVLL